MKKLTNTEDELKKSVASKKSVQLLKTDVPITSIFQAKKIRLQVNFWRASTRTDIMEFATIYNSEVWEQKRGWLSYHFNFERNHDFLKSTSLCFLLNNKVNLNTVKAKRN